MVPCDRDAGIDMDTEIDAWTEILVLQGRMNVCTYISVSWNHCELKVSHSTVRMIDERNIQSIFIPLMNEFFHQKTSRVCAAWIWVSYSCEWT